MRADAMEPEKNVHVSLPEILVEQMQTAARAEHVTVDEFVRDAMERRLRERRRQNFYAYGEGQARKLGIKEEDVDRILHDFRDEERERERHSIERGR